MVKNLSHTLAYSLVALQEMNLAYRYPNIVWSTACLITDAGGAFNEGDEEEAAADEEPVTYNCEIETFIEDAEDEDDENNGDEEVVSKTKKKTKATNYGKIAAALGKMISSGVSVIPPSINRSTFTFSPDIANNAILYGLSGIAKINEDIIKQIMAGRPYKNFDDFKSRIKLTKPQMVNLIKCGAFDEFGDRVEIMHQYINEISDAKKRITLQNMKMLIEHQLIPPEYIHQQKVFNFTKYLKKNKEGGYYKLDEIALNFYQAHYDMDLLEIKGDQYFIKQIVWDKIYKREMETIKKWMTASQTQILNDLNNELTREMWNKYCLGSISKWEMDSVSYYSHEHELANVDMARYEFDDFSKLPEEPEIERMMNIKGKQIPILKIHRICGTVLSRDKAKKSVTILTTSGVVNVKIYGPLFAIYDRQISERDADGKKHVIERSIFSRGNKIAVCGVRDGDSFRAKKYKATPFHLVEEITEIDNETGRITLKARNTENQ